MSKLHQLLAVEKDRKRKATNVLQETKRVEKLYEKVVCVWEMVKNLITLSLSVRVVLIRNLILELPPKARTVPLIVILISQ